MPHSATGTNAHAGYLSHSPIQPFPTTDNRPSAADHSVLTRLGARIKIRVKTSGLDPSSPYTLWAVVFDQPRYCLSTPCGVADLPIVAGHDPRVEASIVYAGGGLSDEAGTGRIRRSGVCHTTWHRRRAPVRPRAARAEACRDPCRSTRPRLSAGRRHLRRGWILCGGMQLRKHTATAL